jgi:hypothetical protein
MSRPFRLEMESQPAAGCCLQALDTEWRDKSIGGCGCRLRATCRYLSALIAVCRRRSHVQCSRPASPYVVGRSADRADYGTAPRPNLVVQPRPRHPGRHLPRASRWRWASSMELLGEWMTAMASQTWMTAETRSPHSGPSPFSLLVVASPSHPVFKKPVEAPLSASGAQDGLMPASAGAAP